MDKKILFISFNEKNEKNQENNVDDLLKYIKNKKPVLVVVCTQNSNPNTKNHFQNYFSEEIIKKEYSTVIKLNYCKEYSKMIYNKGCTNNLRTRIYVKNNSIDNLEIISTKDERSYSMIKLSVGFNQKKYIYSFYNTIDFDIKKINDFTSNIIIANLYVKNEIITYETNIYTEIKMHEKITKKKSENEIEKKVDTKLIKETVFYFINENNINNLINNFGTNISNYIKFINNLLKEKNQKGGKICFSQRNIEKLQNRLSFAENIPNNPEDIGYYTILSQLIISGINKQNLVCLLGGIFEGHNQNKRETLIIFLKKFIEYLYMKNSEESKELYFVVDNLYNEIIDSYKDNIILTNITSNNYTYKDFYINGNCLISLLLEI